MAYGFGDKVHNGGKQYYEAVRDPISHLKYTQESQASRRKCDKATNTQRQTTLIFFPQ